MGCLSGDLGILGVSWTCLVASCKVLGGSRRRLGAILAYLGGLSWGPLGDWVDLGGVLDSLGWQLVSRLWKLFDLFFQALEVI